MAHQDMLGYEVSIGDFVCGPYNNELGIFKVIDLTPKMIKVQHYKGKTARSIRAAYARDIIKLTDEQAKSIVFAVVKGTL